MADLAAIALRPSETDGEARAAAFRDAIGTGRKLAIQILEFFDRAGVTVRNGDLRTLSREKMNRFGAAGP